MNCAHYWLITPPCISRGGGALPTVNCIRPHMNHAGKHCGARCWTTIAKQYEDYDLIAATKSSTAQTVHHKL